jgi:hypothetical protein
MPSSRKRFRHRATFSGIMPICAAIYLFTRPSAARNTMRARSTSRVGSERYRAVLSKAVLCSGFNRSGATVRIL